MTPEKTGELLKKRDREHGCQPLFTCRKICFRKNGKEIWTRLPDASVSIVHAGTSKTRYMLPEENREDDFIIVYTPFDLSEEKQLDEFHYVLADIIEPFPGRTKWRVVRSKHWKEYGFYQAVAVRAAFDCRIPEGCRDCTRGKQAIHNE